MQKKSSKFVRKGMAFLILFSCLLPIFNFIGESNIETSSKSEKNLQFDLNTPSSPLSAAVQWNNVNYTESYLFTGTDPSAKITALKSVDLTRNESWQYALFPEAWNDIIYGDDKGNVMIQQAAPVANPFTASSWNNYAHYNNVLWKKNILNEPIMFVDYAADDSSGYNKKGITVLTKNGSAVHYTNTITNDYDISYNIMYATNWNPVDQTAETDPSEYLSKHNVTAVCKKDLIAPFKSTQVIVGTNTGRIVHLNYWNNYEGSQSYDQILIQDNQTNAINNNTIGIASLDIADVNVDGFRDIVVLYYNGSLKVLLGNAGYSTWTTKNIQLASSLQKFQLGDLDNDGFPDIVGIRSNGLVSLWRNTFGINNNFTGPYNKNTFTGTGCNDLKLADLDRDGDLDMIFAQSDQKIMLLENQRNYNLSLINSEIFGLWTNTELNSKTLSSSLPIYSVLIDDLNEDGWVDFITGHSGGQVHGWNFSISYVDTTQTKFGHELLIANRPSSSSNLFGSKFGDIDRDGDIDIVNAYNSPTGSDIWVYFNPGGFNLYNYSTTWRSFKLRTIENTFTGFDLADIDSDGDLDFLYGTLILGGNQIKIIQNRYDNSSGASFELTDWGESALSLIYNASTSIYGNFEVKDLNQDGNPEIVMFGKTGNLTCYYLTNTFNVFNSADWAQTIINSTSSRSPVVAMDSADVYNVYTPNTASESGLYSLEINYDDHFFADASSVFFMTGRRANTNYRTNPIYNIYTNTSNYIQNAFYSYDHTRRIPIIILGGFNRDYNASYITTLVPNSIDYQPYSWEADMRYYLPNELIQNINKIDMNKDGCDDILVQTNSKLYCVKGLKQYEPITHAAPFTTIISLLNSTETISNTKVVDLDSDGDQDIVIYKSNSFSFIKNGFNDDLTPNYYNFTTNKISTGLSITFNLTLFNRYQLYSRPNITFTIGASSQSFPMIVKTEGSDYYYTYIISTNATIVASIQITNQWGTISSKQITFFADTIVPEFSFSHKPLTNGTIEFWIYNTTETIGDNEVSLNVSTAIYDKYWFYNTNHTYNPNVVLDNQLYYLNNGTWWIRFTLATESGNYHFGINATDIHFIRYAYLTEDVNNDITKPFVRTLFSPIAYTGELSERISLDPAAPHLTLKIQFNERISYIRFWVENGSGTNVFDGSFKEESGLATELYETDFRVKDAGVLTLYVYFKDLAGNDRLISSEFYMNEFKIESFIAKFLGNGLRSYTTENQAWVHISGNNIFRFRIYFDFNGTDGELDKNVSAEWSEWKTLEKPTDFSGINPNDGYWVKFVAGDYGMKRAVVEVTNGYDTQSQEVFIEYRAPSETAIDWRLPALVIASIAGGMIIFVGIKKSIASHEWKKYMKTGPGDDD